MKKSAVRALIVALGFIVVGSVWFMIFVGDPDHRRKLDELADRLDSEPSPEHLRELLNYPADGAYSYYKSALVGVSSVNHPKSFQAVAADPRSEEEFEILQRLASRGAGVFEYHPELKPTDFEKRFEEQSWLAEIRGKPAGGVRR